MTKHEAGDIVLVRYPFTDLTTLKRRPAVILSGQDYSARNSDVVVMPLTSQADKDTTLEFSDWRSAGLLKPTWAKPIIGTLSVRLVERRLGKLASTDESAVRSALAILLEERWRK